MKNNSTVSEEDSMLLPEALPPRTCAGVLGGLSNLQKPILSPWAPGHLTRTSEGTPFSSCHVSCLHSGRQLSSLLLLLLNLAPSCLEGRKEGRSIPLQPPPVSNRSSSLSGQNRTARAFVSSSYLGYEGSGSFRLLTINNKKKCKILFFES